MHKTFVVLAVALAAALTSACSSDDDGSSSSSSSSGSSSTSLTCCFNGSGYRCPTADTLQKACSATDRDPSGCQADSTACDD